MFGCRSPGDFPYTLFSVEPSVSGICNTGLGSPKGGDIAPPGLLVLPQHLLSQTNESPPGHAPSGSSMPGQS